MRRSRPRGRAEHARSGPVRARQPLAADRARSACRCLWWLLRIIPPAPKQIRFPAVRFLLGLEPEEETSARTPLWLLILRLALATLLILALVGPVLNPEPELSGDGPLVLVVDDGWAAAPGWAKRTETLERFAGRAQRQNREVILLGTAPDPAAPALRRLSAADAVAHGAELAAQALAGRPRGRPRAAAQRGARRRRGDLAQRRRRRQRGGARRRGALRRAAARDRSAPDPGRPARAARDAAAPAGRDQGGAGGGRAPRRAPAACRA